MSNIQDRTYDSYYKKSFEVLRKYVGYSTTANMEMNIFRIGDAEMHCIWTHAKDECRYHIVYDNGKLVQAYRRKVNGIKENILEQKK